MVNKKPNGEQANKKGSQWDTSGKQAQWNDYAISADLP